MDNKVYHKNFLDNDLPDKCAQLIIADPPYFQVKGHFDFIWPSFDAYLEDVERWGIECKRLLADNGTLYWWGHAKKIAYAQAILDKYFNLENSIVWKKKDCQTLRSDPEFMRTYAPVTERVLMYSNETGGEGTSEANHKFQIGKKHTEIMEPIVSYMIGEMQMAGYTCKDINTLTGTSMASHWFARTSQWTLPTREWYAKLQDLFNGEYLRKDYEELRKDYEELRKDYEELRKDYEELRRPFFNYEGLQTDVLEYSQESHITKDFNHDTKKPEGLTRSIIKTSSRPNDLVLVPFAGSGTECAMAVKEGRRCIGFDIEPKYVEMSNDRIRSILMQPTLF
jgi:site-specific DNA-methyltransferase (adenine-specific)